MGSNTVEKIMIKIGVDMSELRKKAKRIKSTLNSSFQGTQKQQAFAKKHVQSIDTFTNRVTKGAIPASKKLGEQFLKNEARFQGWAMSIMFAGMAIQRVFLSIWKSATTTFNDVNHSVEGSTTAFDMLQGSLKYLWFTVGEALSPIAEEMIPIILRVQAWVEENEELTASIVKQGIKWGTIIMIVGMAVLGFNGLFTAGKNVLTIFKYMAITNPVIGLIVGIVLAIVWIATLSKKMGGFGEFLKSMLRGVLRIVVLLVDGLAWLFGKIGEGVMWTVNKMIQGINWIIEKVNKIPGINIGTIGKIDATKYQFGDITHDYMDWERDSWLAPKKGYFGEESQNQSDSNNQPQTSVFKFDENALDKMLNGEDVELAKESMS